MRVTSVTVGLPVRDLRLARGWYERVLELGGPDEEPAPGTVEYQVGPVWLQLMETDGSEPVPPNALTVRFGVEDVRSVHQRLVDLDLVVSDVIRVEQAVDYIELSDPDGNRLSFYSMA